MFQLFHCIFVYIVQIWALKCCASITTQGCMSEFLLPSYMRFPEMHIFRYKKDILHLNIILHVCCCFPYCPLQIPEVKDAFACECGAKICSLTCCKCVMSGCYYYLFLLEHCKWHFFRDANKTVKYCQTTCLFLYLFFPVLTDCECKS